MERTYSDHAKKGIFSKVVLLVVTIALLLASLIIMNPLIDAFICFSSLVTLMFSFDVFDSTEGVNKTVFALQIAFVVVSLIKFIIISS